MMEMISPHLSGTVPVRSVDYVVPQSDGEFDPQQLTISAGCHLSAGQLAEPGPVGTPHADWP